MWYIYTVEYYSDIKKNEVMPFAATWMDLEIIILSEVSQTKTNIIWYHLYVESKKNDTNELTYKQKQTHRHGKQTYGHQRGKVGGRDKLGVWDWHVYTAIFKIDNQQGPTYSTGNYIQYLIITYNGKESKTEYMHIYKTESLCCTPETL